MKRVCKLFTNPIVIVLPFVLAALLGWHLYTLSQRHLSVPTERNLLANGSFDVFPGMSGVPAGWQLHVSGSMHDTPSRAPGYIGGSSFKLGISTYHSGDATLTSSKTPLHFSAKYLFKGYYYSTMPIDLLARYYYKDGTSRLEQIQQYPGSGGTWTTVSDAFATGDTITAVQFVFRAASNGTVQLDGAYLEPRQDVSNPPLLKAGPNIIPNPSLTSGSRSAPRGWLTYHDGVSRSKFSYVQSSHGSSVSVSVSNYKNGEAKWQYAAMPVTPDQYYQFGVSYKSDTSVDVVAEYQLKNGQREFDTLTTLTPADQWTHVTTAFTVPPDATTMFVSAPLQHNGTIATTDYSLINETKPGPLHWKRPLVSITFDDGWQSAYQNAVPILRQFGFRSTYYINASSINTRNFMTGDELKNLHVGGNEIAVHGYEHLDMTALDDVKLHYELTRGRDYLRQAGFPADDFAVPYGRTDAEVRWEAERDFDLLRGTDTGINTRQNLDPYDLKVLYFESNTPDQTIRDALREAAASDGWLILVYHQVGPRTNSPVAADVGDINIPAPAFIRQMQAVKNSGIAVKTVDGAYDEIRAQQ